MQALRELLTDEFQVAAHIYSTGESLYTFLSESKHVQAIRAEIASSHLSERGVEDFVRGLMGEFRQGTRFPWESALAAIAVALASVPGDFADKFLADLAELRVAEMPLSPRVAKLAMAQRRASVAPTIERQVFPAGGNLVGHVFIVGSGQAVRVPDVPHYIAPLGKLRAVA